MSDIAFKYHLISRLLSQLEAEGYALGTGQYLRVQDLLSKLPDDIPVEALGEYLAPLFAQSPKQQHAFYDIFRQNLETTQQYYQRLDNKPLGADVDSNSSIKRWWRLTWGLGAIFLLPPLIVFLLWIFTPDTPGVIVKPFHVKGGTSKQECVSDSLDLADEPAVAKATLIYQHNDQLGSVIIDTPYCITYVADSLSGKDSIIVELKMENEEVQLVCFLPEIQGVAPAPKEKNYRGRPTPVSLDTSYTFYNKIPLYDHDILAYHISEPPWWKTFISQNFWWLKWLGLLSFTALLLAIMRYRSAKRQNLVISTSGKDQPPYAYHLKLKGIGQIQMGTDFAYVLNRIRQRTNAEAIRLDIPRTISATIQKAGMVDFQFSRQTRPPEYLLLIDRQSERNHRARLFDYIFRLFKANEVLIERFFYDGDPRVCHNKQYPNGILLQDLQQQYGNARLLILGNGSILLNKFTGKPVEWSHLLLDWKDRVLFTPRPTKSWNKQERRLKKILTVLPVSMQSLNFWLEQLENEEDANFDNWHKYVEDASVEPLSLDGLLIDTLKKRYGEQMLQWIAACAIYPSLHWDLTLHFGQWLSNDDVYLLNVEHMLQLTQLSWFVEGKIPEVSRLQLIEWMEAEHPQTLHQLREEAVRLLENNPPPQNSSAYEDYRLNVALNDWLITDDNRRKRILEQEISQYLELGGEVDVTVINKLEKQRSILDTAIPDKWKHSFYNQGLPGLGWKGEWGDMLKWAMPLWLCALLLTLWPWQLERSKCADGAIVDYVEGRQDVSGSDQSIYPLCINDVRAVFCLMEKSAFMNLDVDSLRGNDRLLTSSLTIARQFFLPAIEGNVEEQLLWRAQLSEPLEVQGGTLNKEILGYSFTPNNAGLDSLQVFLPQYRSNKAIALYNLGVEYSHQFEDNEEETAFSRACFFFDLAINTDSIAFAKEEKEKIANWCDNSSSFSDSSGVVGGWEPECFVVSKAVSTLSVRSRLLSAKEKKELNQHYGQPTWSKLPLNRETLIGALSRGEEVVLLEEGDDYYKIQTPILEGYIVKVFSGAPTLITCEEAVSPPVGDNQNSVEPTPTDRRIIKPTNSDLLRGERKNLKPVINPPTTDIDKGGTNTDSRQSDRQVQLISPDSLRALSGQLEDCNLSIPPISNLELDCIEITKRVSKATFTLRNPYSKTEMSYSIFPPRHPYAFYLVDENNNTYQLRSIQGAKYGDYQILNPSSSITFTMSFDRLPAATDRISIISGNSYQDKENTYWNFRDVVLDWK